MPTRTQDELVDEYEACERNYLEALQQGEADRARLAVLASEVRHAADAWQTVAYADFFAAKKHASEHPRELEISAEKAEMLTQLWDDIAAAHSGRPIAAQSGGYQPPP